jgi:hypothetical protein
MLCCPDAFVSGRPIVPRAPDDERLVLEPHVLDDSL